MGENKLNNTKEIMESTYFKMVRNKTELTIQ